MVSPRSFRSSRPHPVPPGRLPPRSPAVSRAVVLAQTSAAFGSKDPSWEEAFIRSRLGPLDAGHSMADLANGMVADLLGPAPDPDGAALARDCFAHVPDSTYRDTVLALRGFLETGSDRVDATAPTPEDDETPAQEARP